MNDLKNAILPDEPNKVSYDAIGSKAKGLLFLKQHQFNVPAFFLLNNETLGLVSGKALSILQLVNEWVQQYAIPADSLWTVRSSANVEDGKEESFAGLFHTEINVPVSALPKAIEAVISGYEGVNKLQYGRVENLQFGLIIQQMVASEYSGVAFSHNPFDPTKEEVFVNIVPGLGVNLVSGKENACTLKSPHQGVAEWTNLEDTFSGQIFSGELQSITKTGNEIKQAILPHLDDLLNGIRRLAKLKKIPVDIEFTVAGNQLYWLQVRPITSKACDKILAIWDNSNIGENYPDITLPLSISFARHTYFKAYTGMAAFLGMSKKTIQTNEPLIKNMVGGIHGALYYNVTAWQKLLFQLPLGKKTSKQITRMWAMEDAEFQHPPHGPSVWNYLVMLFNLMQALFFFKRNKREFESVYRQVLTDFDKKAFVGKSHVELVDIFHHIDRKLTENWIVPLLSGFFAMIFFSALKRIVRNSRLQSDYPNFSNDILFSQGDVISVAIVREFQELLKMFQENKALFELFSSEQPESIWEKLPATFPIANERIRRYIELYGERCGGGELKLETINYKEDPLRFIAFMQSNMQVAVFQRAETWSFDYRKVLRENYQYHPLRRTLLTMLINATVARMKDRENYRFLRTKAFAMMRELFRAVDRELIEHKKIEIPSDSLHLYLEHLLDTETVTEYKSIIAKNKLKYREYETMKRASRYLQTSTGLVPVEKNQAAHAKTQMKGIGCCSGTVTAKVALINIDSIEHNQIAGCILVANYFEPGWVNLFAQAAGVISEKGNLLSHTAILCREMGIPAIVGAKGILSALQDGDTLQMNGSTGDINIL